MIVDLHQPDPLGGELWHPPATFRASIEDTERLARQLLEQLQGNPALLIPTERLEFLARRPHRIARGALNAVPPEVS